MTECVGVGVGRSKEGKGEWLDNNDGQRRRGDYVFARVIQPFSAIRRSFP